MLGCWARRLTMPCRRVATAKLSSWSTHCMPPASPVLALRAPASTCAAAAAAFGAVVTSCSCQSGAAKLPPAFEDVLKKIDADGDGTVSKEGVLAMFKRMDVDHDGKVTKTEFVVRPVGHFPTMRRLRRHRPPYSHALLNPRDAQATLGQCGVAPAAAEEIFKALDADGSGSLSQGEFEKFRDGPGRNVRASSACSCLPAVAAPCARAVAHSALTRRLGCGRSRTREASSSPSSRRGASSRTRPT